MKVTLLRSAIDTAPGDDFQYLTTYLVNDCLAIDAGCLGLVGSPKRQSDVRDVLLTHSHLDHIASLPVFLENIYEGRADCVTIHASQAVLDCLQQDVFNNRVWPDFIAISEREPNSPFLKLAALDAGQTVEIQGVRVTPVEMNHIVPTFGYVLEDDSATVVIVSDTGPTDEIWMRANAARNLKAVFLEITFPNEMSQIADISKHLTTAMFGVELGKLTRPARVLTIHLKARYAEQISRELDELSLPNVELVQFGRVYEF
ncbi:MAG: 3',5'-cyclic-nucleotide phosphodiesterase [Planctomycetales bacterium]|nr:3',5'-cyclic-nucleotide phosphodiesterase [Planctomycetales bacterium]